jgi:hypothetical protein
VATSDSAGPLAAADLAFRNRGSCSPDS